MDNIISALNHLNPAELDYDSWLRVGMALRNEGYPVSVWDDWSKNDSRYREGVCEKKWKSFENGPADRVTGGSIVQMAKDAGWQMFANDGALDWDSEIEYDGTPAPSHPVNCRDLSPVEQLKTYLKTLFRPEDILGYCTNDVWKNEEGRYMPSKGVFTRKVSELLSSLEHHPDDLSKTVGDWKKDCGGWIRFNPLDGKGVKNENVTAFRYALVESDDMPLENQEAFYRASSLPVAALVYSGGKSLHAIVHIDAKDYEEYRERVRRLYDWLAANGISIDKQNRNPSRLSRMPGVTRSGKVQQLLGVNLGCASWDEWVKTIEEEFNNDGLPEFSVYDGIREHLPEQPGELIHGVLRMGHKMLVSGPSKAGKSYLLMELCVAIAEGRPWLGFECRKGKVLYINLEIDPASCMHRLADIYDAMQIPPNHSGDIQVWNLRGKALPLDGLAPKIISRAKDQGFNTIILDPIYKVITGDENNATDMGYFCNEFDRIAEETGCAIIYCHHHSKGAQGAKKAQDRASGSGVFARDPDAQLDMIQLELSEDIRESMENSGDTAWRLEGSLREFPNIKPVNFWFRYPIHVVDGENLNTAPAEGSFEAMRAKNRKYTTPEERRNSVDSAYEACKFTPPITLKAMADYLNITERCMRVRVKEAEDTYWVKGGMVGLKSEIPESEKTQNSGKK